MEKQAENVLLVIHTHPMFSHCVSDISSTLLPHISSQHPFSLEADQIHSILVIGSMLVVIDLEFVAQALYGI